ncbi:MAG: DUF2164 domain-containing protein [Myxococcota bacterium]
MTRDRIGGVVPITLAKDKKKGVIRAIQTYFDEKLDREIGDLGAELLIDFFLKELGPAIYNQAILDSQAFFQDKLIDLEAQLFQDEPRS